MVVDDGRVHLQSKMVMSFPHNLEIVLSNLRASLRPPQLSEYVDKIFFQKTKVLFGNICLVKAEKIWHTIFISKQYFYSFIAKFTNADIS
jgi:hypothetical protein